MLTSVNNGLIIIVVVINYREQIYQLFTIDDKGFEIM